MAKTLQEYADWLDRRRLMWPAAPETKPVKATAFTKPLDGIRAVSWSLYGTLLRITDGRLMIVHPQPFRMQVVLEKTIEEFNMWNSMYRKPGAPWEYMMEQHSRFVEERQMAATKVKGDVPEVNSAGVWRKLVDQLREKEYQYDEGNLGGLDELSEKVAYFFQSSLQGGAAAEGALAGLQSVADAGLVQGLLADAQPFSTVQLLRALKQQGTLPPLNDLFDQRVFTLSYQEGVRKPSKSLFEAGARRFADLDIEPQEVLHVGSRLVDDLAVAKQIGMKTALYAGDQTSVQATKSQIRDPQMRPDRLLTDLLQIRDVIGAA